MIYKIQTHKIHVTNLLLQIIFVVSRNQISEDLPILKWYMYHVMDVLEYII